MLRFSVPVYHDALSDLMQMDTDFAIRRGLP